MYLTGPHPPSATVPVSQRARVIFWMMDSATSPFGSAQNDRVRSILVREMFLDYRIHMEINWRYVHWYWVDAVWEQVFD